MAKNSLSTFYRQPANFLYIFATDDFIAKLGRRAGYIIRTKKANQKKLLNTTAVDEGKTYTEAYNAMAEAFKSYYGVTPQKALVILAEGGEVAGKNWSKGVYGVGAPDVQNGEVLVNYKGNGVNSFVAIDDNGHFINSQTGASLKTEVVSYGKDGKMDCVKYTDENGVTYTANYSKKYGWYSSEYCTKDGETFKANGSISTPADMSSIWESLALSFDKLIEWLLSLFNNTNNTNKVALSAANTQPNQQDGWVSNAGVSPWILLAMAGGVILSGGFGKFWKSAKKSRK